MSARIFRLFSLESSVLHKLRSHDSEIVSLHWTSWKPSVAEPNNDVSGVTERLSKLEVSKPKEKTPERQKQKGREPPKAIVDAGDMFDIHSFDYLEEEFGTIAESKESREKLDKSVDEGATDDRNSGTTNEKFDFAEACQSLREQIRSNQSDTDGSETTCDISAVNLSDITDLYEPETTVSDGDNVDKSQAELEPNQAEPESSEVAAQEKETIYLASGAQEPFVVIWNVDNGSIHDKIQLKPQPGKSPIPSKYSAAGRRLIII